ncbi:putative ATPase [Paenochrobactrum gallinarii]|uniref:Putative ATPase n=1 Tax=Paenochrobactrum gallinarii TaxID=643673 RepID=A0A841LTG2_9HYPH|nr:putative ATPase [Paenochrobactrum gallinarii]
MNHISDQFIILTGGPGAGKTSLLENLKKEGFQCSDEAGRGIIQSQNLINGPFHPWLDPSGFA